jgi:uncharacterized protein (TIGR00297 family)
VFYALGLCAAAYGLRLLSWDGALAAALVGGLVWEAGGLSWSIPLLLFFVTSSLLGVIFRVSAVVHVQRKAIQVFANGGACGLCAVLFLVLGDDRFGVAAIAGLAAANADTWATEIGTKFGRRFFRITTLASARKGVSGVISVVGVVGSFFGAAVIASTLPLLSATHLIGLVTLIGFVGALLDSFLGDTIQRRDDDEDKRKHGLRWMTNDMVNFVTVCLATIAGYFAAA